MSSSSALIAPSSSAVFTCWSSVQLQLVIGLSAIAIRVDEPRDERGAIGQRLDVDVFVQRVRAVADRAEAV